MTKKEDYSQVHDEESDRTRVELWIIVAIVVVVIVAALGWRLITHRPVQPASTTPPAANMAGAGVPAAAAGIQTPRPPPPTPAQ